MCACRGWRGRARGPCKDNGAPGFGGYLQFGHNPSGQAELASSDDPRRAGGSAVARHWDRPGAASLEDADSLTLSAYPELSCRGALTRLEDRAGSLARE